MGRAAAVIRDAMPLHGCGETSGPFAITSVTILKDPSVEGLAEGHHASLVGRGASGWGHPSALDPRHPRRRDPALDEVSDGLPDQDLRWTRERCDPPSYRDPTRSAFFRTSHARSRVLHFMTRNVRCVTPAPSITRVLSRSIGPVPRWSNNETPPRAGRVPGPYVSRRGALL